MTEFLKEFWTETKIATTEIGHVTVRCASALIALMLIINFFIMRDQASVHLLESFAIGMALALSWHVPVGKG